MGGTSYIIFSFSCSNLIWWNFNESLFLILSFNKLRKRGADIIMMWRATFSSRHSPTGLKMALMPSSGHMKISFPIRVLSNLKLTVGHGQIKILRVEKHKCLVTAPRDGRAFLVSRSRVRSDCTYTVGQVRCVGRGGETKRILVRVYMNKIRGNLSYIK